MYFVAWSFPRGGLFDIVINSQTFMPRCWNLFIHHLLSLVWKSAFCLSVTQTSWTEMSQNHPFLNVIPAIIHLAPASCLPNYFLPQIDDHKTLPKLITKHCQNWHKNSQRENNSPCQLLHFTKNLWLWKAKHREDFGCVN